MVLIIIVLITILGDIVIVLMHRIDEFPVKLVSTILDKVTVIG